MNASELFDLIKTGETSKVQFKEVIPHSDGIMLLQASYDVKKAEQLETKNIPDLDKFRKVLFWDTSFDKIDWDKNKRPIIIRVLERGNSDEINEIISFYGKETISEIIKSVGESRLSSFQINIEEYNLN